MRHRYLLIALAVFAFALMLLARLPVSWLRPLLPSGITCDVPSGSIWNGRCGTLTFAANGAPLTLGAVNWQLAPGALLRLKLAGTLNAEGPALVGQARFSVGPGGDALIENAAFDAPLDRRLLAMVPSNWTGRLRVRLARIELRSQALAAVNGTIEAHDVVAQGPRPDTFGSYALEFPPNAMAPGSFRGLLRDLQGPVEVTGTLDVRANLDWELNANVRARPSATPQLARLLEFLGPPDAQGHRTFSAAGDF